MDFGEFIKPELLALVPVLYVIGIALKKSKVSDSLIPLLLGVISVILAAFWVVATSDIATIKDIAYALFVSVTQGILSAGSSVYFNQLYVQSKKKINK
jgi:multidrug transporter EmrE-like cation transporter